MEIPNTYLLVTVSHAEKLPKNAYKVTIKYGKNKRETGWSQVDKNPDLNGVAIFTLDNKEDVLDKPIKVTVEGKSSLLSSGRKCNLTIPANNLPHGDTFGPEFIAVKPNDKNSPRVKVMATIVDGQTSIIGPDVKGSNHVPQALMLRVTCFEGVPLLQKAKKMHPVAELKFGKHVMKAVAVEGGEGGIFPDIIHSRYIMSFPPKGQDMPLKVKLINTRSMLADQSLGTASVPLTRLMDGAVHDLTPKMKGGKSGEYTTVGIKAQLLFSCSCVVKEEDPIKIAMRESKAQYEREQAMRTVKQAEVVQVMKPPAPLSNPYSFNAAPTVVMTPPPVMQAPVPQMYPSVPPMPAPTSACPAPTAPTTLVPPPPQMMLVPPPMPQQSMYMSAPPMYIQQQQPSVAYPAVPQYPPRQ